MGNYLDKFSKLIGKRQAEQVLTLLNKKKNTGQIRSAKEFSDELNSLMFQLNSTVLTPTLKLYEAEANSTISSETYNFMLERVEDDLLAAFEEAGNIDTVQKSHEAIIRDVILKNLRAGVAELEAKISLYEFLNRDTNGFDVANFSTFRESKEERTFRDNTSITFSDPRTTRLFATNEDASIELIGERLTLPNTNKTQHQIQNIRQIFDSTTVQSEVIVEPPSTSLSNLIDNTTGTYWIQSLLFKEEQQFIKVKLELNLGIVKEINYLEIEPASRYGLVLEAVHYIDGNNIVTELVSPELSFDSPISIQLKKTATNRIILTFRNEHSSQIAFEYDPKNNSLINQALSEPPEGQAATISTLAPMLNQLISSGEIKKLVTISPNTKSNFSGYEFITGFDNIRVGLATYRNKGIYISTPVELKDMGMVGLRTVEARPYIDQNDLAVRITNTTYDLSSDSALTPEDVYFQGSIEYWCTKQDLSIDGTLLRSTVFPILPLNVDKIYHERLLLTDKSSSLVGENDLGETIFFTYGGVSYNNITVYENGIALTNQNGVLAASSGWKQYPDTATPGDVVDRSPNSGIPMRFQIQILSPLPGNIYTVTYTPLVSTTQNIPTNLDQYTSISGLKIVDLVGDLTARSTNGQVVVLSEKRSNIEVAKSKVFLSIILRQNTAESSLTPAVEEYTLLAGFRDNKKFKGD